MKILLLTTWYPDHKNPNRGVFVRDQAEALSKQYKVEVVFAAIDYSKFSLFSFTISKKQNKGLTEHHIMVNRSLPVINQLVFFWIVIGQTKKIARGFSPDLVHGNIGYPGAFWSWAVSRSLKVPYVITEHTRIANNFRSWFHKSLTLFGLKRASGITSVSSWHAQEIKSIVGRKVSVAGNIIRIEKFNAVNRASPSQPVHFGILASMNTDGKGLDLLLQACASIQEAYVLHLGGSGKLLDTYLAMAENLGIAANCKFHGFVTHSQVPDFMAQLHFFVSSSKSETFGMVMAEAMAAGLPVVATDSGGSAELINSQNGILVSSREPELLASALKTMIHNYTRYDADRIKESVNQYSEKSFLNRIQKIYEEALVINTVS